MEEKEKDYDGDDNEDKDEDRAAQIVGLSRHMISFRIIFSESVF